MRAELLLVLATLSAYAKKDWDKFKRDRESDPTLTFRWSVALKQYAEAVGLAVLPSLMAKVWTILGGV